jgi:hypothetical protein
MHTLPTSPGPQSSTLGGSPDLADAQQVWPRMRQWLASALELWPEGEPLRRRLLALGPKVGAGAGRGARWGCWGAGLLGRGGRTLLWLPGVLSALGEASVTG